MISLSGHYWTVAPVAASLWRRPPLSTGRPWTTTLADPQIGPVTLSGVLHAQKSDTAVLVVHGLGGDVESHYVRRAAAAALAAGYDCLRLNLRGADMSGEDYYHAGLTADLHAAIGSEALARHRRVLVIGYSLGGHLALRYASEVHDPRLGAVAAICPPLDLALAARDFDAPHRAPYRRYVMGSLRAMMRATAARRPLPLPLSEVLAITRVRAWDAGLVAPRFGFAGPDDYYAKAGVAERLHKLAVPSLIVAATRDPMVLARSLRAALRERHRHLEVRWLDRAGHVGFPPAVDLAETGPLGLEPQVVSWLARSAS